MIVMCEPGFWPNPSGAGKKESSESTDAKSSYLDWKRAAAVGKWKVLANMTRPWCSWGTELDKKKVPKVHLAKNDTKGGKNNMLCRTALFVSLDCCIRESLGNSVVPIWFLKWCIAGGTNLDSSKCLMPTSLLMEWKSSWMTCRLEWLSIYVVACLPGINSVRCDAGI